MYVLLLHIQPVDGIWPSPQDWMSGPTWIQSGSSVSPLQLSSRLLLQISWSLGFVVPMHSLHIPFMHVIMPCLQMPMFDPQGFVCELLHWHVIWSSVRPLQSSSIPLQISLAGSVCPVHLDHEPFMQVFIPCLHLPTFEPQGCWSFSVQFFGGGDGPGGGPGPGPGGGEHDLVFWPVYWVLQLLLSVQDRQDWVPPGHWDQPVQTQSGIQVVLEPDKINIWSEVLNPWKDM